MTEIFKIHVRRHEPYNEGKLARSIVASCLSVRTPVGEARLTAIQVCRHVHLWLAEKDEVTSRDLRVHAARFLGVHNPDAAYIYKNNYTK